MPKKKLRAGIDKEPVLVIYLVVHVSGIKGAISVQLTLEAVEHHQKSVLLQKANKCSNLLVVGRRQFRPIFTSAHIIERRIDECTEIRLSFIEGPPEDTLRPC